MLSLGLLVSLGIVSIGALAMGVAAIGIVAGGVSSLGVYATGVAAAGKEIATGVSDVYKRQIQTVCGTPLWIMFFTQAGTAMKSWAETWTV